jgi:3,4-dihydroxy 2-butanone 4-phosphate synthase/GTP cyclohydrolase II
VSAPRPTVTVTYAQSLDGCLTAEPGRPTALSGPEALRFTHRLRAEHDAILVGLGTVRADNPRLTVRHAEGPNPQPVVLDSALHFPLDAALLTHPTRQVWIAARDDASPERQRALEARGARVLRLPADDSGRVSVPALLDALGAEKVRSLMVEGGARVITSVLASGLADRLLVTIAPRLLGGLRAIAAPLDLKLREVRYTVMGEDVVIEATVADTPESSVVGPPSSV